MKYTSTSLAETEQVVSDFLTSLKPQQTATVLALHGDLGAGKTAFTKIMAQILGVSLEVTSPTFVIEKVYDIKNTEKNKVWPFTRLVHIDAYRLETYKEIERLHWQEKIEDSHNLIVVEWPEKIAEALPAHTHHLYFEFIDETTRTIELPNNSDNQKSN